MDSALKNTAAQGATNNDVMVAKIVAMAVLGICSFTLGILPIKLTKMISIHTADGDKKLVISLLLCFGGGVLLFTTFIHLQPEVRESFESMKERDLIPNFGKNLPLSELVFCFGFFFVYLVEEAVHMLLDRKKHNDTLHRTLSVRRCDSKNDLTIPRVNITKLDDGNISYISTSNKELLNSQTTINTEKQSNEHNHMNAALNSVSGFLAVLALSFHAVFEGLAVGLENEAKKVWYLFAAVATHKLVIGFCVGVELVTSKTKVLLILLYMGTFAIVTPLGIGAGIILSGKQNDIDVTSVVLQGMAAGTLLYVVFFEVLARERGNKHSGLWQLLAILSGFSIMFILQILTGHEHNHNADHAQNKDAVRQYIEATTAQYRRTENLFR